MSGHSKWHNIQKTKGAADAKRSQIFTKIAREMIVAVKQGGSGDPNNNSRLATVIAKAKAANMPNDNIKRTIDKALGSGNADDFESVVYEGYGPCGVAVIVEALTDVRLRRCAIFWTSTERGWALPAVFPGPLIRRVLSSLRGKTWMRIPL
jgi:YebC/PmpR family DNA-binding regulatory protein